ncbi:SDR family oxidoreductase [Marinobacter halotolerans]|uniref:SDR family oxidoreductase n=1 Tax=Marinobacter halotolerans TaxID=1569211 RepID=UPI0012484117|nr:SDR family oxidoreductase [Marinobacter halotolerans]
MKLHDRTFLVIGGTGGIGRALVARLLSEGAHVIVTSRHQTNVTGLETVDVVTLDLETTELETQLGQISERFPQIDGVIYCAGQNRFASLEQTDTAMIDTQLDTNLRAPMLVARHFLPRLRNTKQSLMAFIGSTYGSIGFPGYAVYCASKFGLRGFTEALRREVADSNLSILYVAPRATATAMNPAAVEQMNKALGNQVDKPDEVASQILRAIHKNARMRFLGWPERLFVLINSVLPRIVDRALRKQLPVIRQFMRGGAI